MAFRNDPAEVFKAVAATVRGEDEAVRDPVFFAVPAAATVQGEDAEDSDPDRLLAAVALAAVEEVAPMRVPA